MKISVKPDKSVLVSFPFFVSDKEVLSFLSKNETWILHRQQELTSRRKVPGAGDVIKTKTAVIEFRHSNDYKIESSGMYIYFHAPEFTSAMVQTELDKLLTTQYRIEARKFLPARLNALALKHGFRYEKVTIRNNRRNWGSCSSRNNISLNLQMMKLPDELIDYILLHELVHTEIKNHGERFWKRLDQLTDNKSKDLAREIRKYSTYTL